MSIQDIGLSWASTEHVGGGIKGKKRKAHLESLVVRKFIEGNLMIKSNY